MLLLRIIVLILGWQVGSACGTASQAQSYVTLTPDEEARQALEAEDFARAIEKYQALVQAEPTRYERYPFLSAAYAGAAGFDLFAVAKSTLSSEGSASLVDQLGAFLPAVPTIEELEAMRLAKDTLLSMPAEHRDRSSQTFSYASSASLQLSFYQAAYVIMYIKQFRALGADGTLDRNRLETMSEADAVTILENFEAIAAMGGTGVPEGAAAVLAQVDAEEGATRRDKLIQYLSK
jgi:hypothetical protein